MGWTKKSPANMGLAVAPGDSIRMTGYAHIVNGATQGQRVTQAQQGALEVIVETPDTANPILDQVVTTITVNDTRDSPEISYIAWDGNGDGDFNDFVGGYDAVWNYSGGNRNPPKTESFTVQYMGDWSGVDTTRHLEVAGLYYDKDGNIKTYLYKKEFPLHVKYVSELEHDFITSASKRAEVNELINQNADAIADYWSQGNEICALPKENYLQALNYVKNCPDNRMRFNDTSNNVSFSACGNIGTTGCVYETPYDVVMEMFAPYLEDTE